MSNMLYNTFHISDTATNWHLSFTYWLQTLHPLYYAIIVHLIEEKSYQVPIITTPWIPPRQ